MRVGHELLATIARLAPRGSLQTSASPGAGEIKQKRPLGLVTRIGGFRFSPCDARGKKTGNSPVDRRKKGSKHHVLTDGNGTPMHATLTGANRHDLTQLLPLLDGIPAVAGKRGRPRKRFKIVQADRAYHSEPHRKALRKRGIKPLLARRNTPHGSGLGIYRWPVERTLSWMHQDRRLRVRDERRDDIHEAFMELSQAMICWSRLHSEFC